MAQSRYQFTLAKTVEECTNANAALDITGAVPADIVAINWSTGETNTKNAFDLKAGDHSVHINIRHLQDTVINSKDTVLTYIKDTTIYFTIDKEQCVVAIPRYFSPNGDNYSDVLGIGNIGKYPDFELSIFNKWGQRVHHQSSVYVPWDGTWLGVDLPDATYFFVFFYEASNKNKFVKGDITIIR